MAQSSSSDNVRGSVCWNDGHIIPAHVVAKERPIWRGFMGNSYSDISLRGFQTEGHFCSWGCISSYNTRGPNAYAYQGLLCAYMHVLGHSADEIRELGSPYVQDCYNVCGKHRVDVSKYRNGNAANTHCMYARIDCPPGQVQSCYPITNPATVFMCWWLDCSRAVHLANAVHIPTHMSTDGKDLYGKGLFCSVACAEHFARASNRSAIRAESLDLLRLCKFRGGKAQHCSLEPSHAVEGEVSSAEARPEPESPVYVATSPEGMMDLSNDVYVGDDTFFAQIGGNLGFAPTSPRYDDEAGLSSMSLEIQTEPVSPVYTPSSP